MHVLPPKEQSGADAFGDLEALEEQKVMANRGVPVLSRQVTEEWPQNLKKFPAHEAYNAPT